MASSVSDDSLDSEVFNLENSVKISDRFFIHCEDEIANVEDSKSNLNVVNKITNRQIYGRFTRNPKASTERIFNDVFYKCRYRLDQIIPKCDALSHIFMGFTLCGKFFVSYTTRLGEPSSSTSNFFPTIEYELHIWRFVPGQHLQYVTKHRIFKLFKSSLMLDEVTFMQFPLDPYKLICYAIASGTPPMTFLTILTLPTKNCRNCKEKHMQASPTDDKWTQGWCLKHGFMLHFMFTMSHPAPSFNPHISLAFPNHLVINTGHCIHILNISILEPIRTVIGFTREKDYISRVVSQGVACNCIDNLSEVSESPSELFANNSVVDAILEDFSEYDLEGLDSDCSDSDSRLMIIKQVHNFSTSHSNDHRFHQHSGLLIVDSKCDETPKWIKKVVKRYSSVDFENSSLLSGQSRDDYNIPIEIPLLVQTLTEQHLDIVPEIKADQVSETQLIITQRTCDCDQFVQSRAQKLCLDAQLEFLHCEDYDIKILHICPLNGDIICKAVITIGALQDLVPYGKRNLYIAECIFTWNIASNAFEVIEPPIKFKLQSQWSRVEMPLIKIPSIVHRKVLIMDHLYQQSKRTLRDYNNCFEICMDNKKPYGGSGTSDEEYYDEYSIPSDSD